MFGLFHIYNSTVLSVEVLGIDDIRNVFLMRFSTATTH